MKKFFQIFIGISLKSTVILAQCTNTCGPNLMLNSGFETTTASCGNGDIQIYQNQSPVANWYGTEPYSLSPATGSTPDYFSPCAGSTNSANLACLSGNARIGIFTKASFALGREYVQSQLSSSLQAGKTYCFSMTVKSRVGAAGNLLSSCDGIGAWFHNQGLIDIDAQNGGNQFLGPGSIVNANPQVENPSGNLIGASCVTVTGTFCAQGNENYIVLGNFRDDVNTMITGSNPSNYMYIDDVVLYELCGPTIDLTTSNPSIACGDNATLTVNSSYPAGTTYTWISPIGNTLNGLGPHVVTPTSTSTYSIVASYTNSCGLLSDTSEAQISVGPCGIGADLYDTVLCAGNCHNLQAYNPLGGTAPYTFQWTDAQGTVIGSSVGPINVCPATSSTYYFIMSDISGVSFTDSLMIQIYDYPIVNAGADTTICSGTSLQINGTTNIGVGEWQTLGIGNNFLVTPLVNTTYIYQAENNGCLSIDTIQINVNTAPQIDVQSTNISCFGNSDGTISASVSGASPFNYNWYPISGTNNENISGLPGGWELVEVTDVFGCISLDSAFISQPLSLQIIITGDSLLCLNESTILTATVTGGTPGFTYNWNNGLGSNQNYPINPITNETAEVQVTDANGCEMTQTINIQINPSPEVSFNGEIQLCSGIDTIIQNHSSNVTSFQWFVNGIYTANTSDFNFTEDDAGCYDIQLIGENQFGCSDTMTQLCAIEIQTSPQSIVSPSTNLVFIDDPVAMILNNSINEDSCSWYLNNQLLVQPCGANFQQNFTELGVYHFVHYAINSFGCIDSSSFTIDVREGLIYYVPNSFTPDGDEYNNLFTPVFTSGFDPYNFQLVIYNRWGELIFESFDYQTGWDGTLNGNMCQDGTYTWKISFKDLYSDKKYELVGSVTLLR